MKCKYCDNPATKTLVWLKDKQQQPARIKLPWCGCDLMVALRRIWASPYEVKEGIDYEIEPLAPEATTAKITLDYLSKVELKVGTIISATPLEKTKKLILLKVSVGHSDYVPIVAGIKEHYKPEDLIGKQIVVCTNLEPARLGGELSQGMLMAASDDAGLSLLTVDKPRHAGALIK